MIRELHVHADGRAVAPDPLTLAAQRLATSVGRQWTEEAGFRSLLRPNPLRLQWSTTDRPVVLGGLSEQPVRQHGDRHELVEMFRALPHRRLVILGAPGAGKTVLALLLVLALLDDLADNDPVPVLMTASSWNPQEEHLHTWLVRRLVEEYPGLADERTYGPNAAIRLVTEGRIIPIIDGLDETPEGAHAAALDALDRGSAGNHPLVVTCRTMEYAAAVEAGGTVLSRAAVVEIAPVDPVDVTGFLGSAGPSAHRRWQPVLDRLRTRPDAPLARALTSPLMVALARTVYTDPQHDPAELLDPARFAEQTAIEGHLLDSFVSAAYHQQPEVPGRTWSSRRSRYPADQAQEWLRFLAEHLDRLHTRDLAWWEVVHAVSSRTRGLLAALTSSLLAAVTGFLADGPANGVFDVLGYILWFGLAPFVVFLRGYVPRPLHIELTFHATAGRVLRRFAVGFAIGFTLGIAYGLDYPLALIAGLAPGFALASYTWWSIPTDVTQVSSPATVLRRERLATAAFGSILGAAFGVVVGLVYGFAANLTLSTGQAALAGVAAAAAMGVWGYVQYGRAAGLLYGLTGGLVAGLTAASAYAGPIKNPALLGLVYGLVFALTIGYGGVLSRAWGVFLLHRTWLALCGRLPWRLMAFLDDAHRRGILRQAGGVYQFRHALLQDHLARPRDEGRQDHSSGIPQQRGH
ncbi:NACHT domain-containing protein [Kutzneria sp. CA-103260]|uniref:NACHT domain-containing protein n=1 Tax=Kutzneria sp. CA-103260 TaxID=2802641 RepID=UPI001BA6940D|nr:NACHT domain-containing protein [Kutzneria sp. CA-103260]QUQ62324.1 SARP family transcriptional regulator [Kutzneria sp. CA-103260]